MMASLKVSQFLTAVENSFSQNQLLNNTKRQQIHIERQIMKNQILDVLAAIAIGAAFAILLAWRG